MNLASKTPLVLLLSALAFVACSDDDDPPANNTPPADNNTNNNTNNNTDPTLTGLSIMPGSISFIEVGGTQALTVTGTFDDGSMSDVTADATFMSSDAAVATVGVSGTVVAAGVGTASISASLDGQSASIVVTVSDGIPLPMAVDDWFSGRAGFSDTGAPLYTEDATEGACPMRAGDQAGVCHSFTWDGTGGAFTGVFWINGEGFENLNPLPVVGGATELSFWAWGTNGGEVIEFGAGLVPQTDPMGQDGVEIRQNITLTTTPTEYTISLAAYSDYSDVWGPFIMAISGASNPNGATFYIDDIVWQIGDAPVEVPLPMVVDEVYSGRSAFGDGGAPLHTEDATETACDGANPPADAVGVCHRFTWDGTGGGFTGAFWTIGDAFMNLQSRTIAAGANTEISFYAWAASGSPRIEFGYGDPDRDADTIREFITLSTIPTEYTISLAAFTDFNAVFGPFIWAASAGDNPTGVDIYIDGIQWRVGGPPADELVVFGDNFGNGVTFAPFDGSTNAISVVTDNPQSGTAALQVVVPAAGYTGGALRAAQDVDLSGFNALTFWARADADNPLNVTGVGDDSQSSTARLELNQVALTSTWQEFTIPIPSPAALAAEDGLFHFAEGSEHGAYTVFLDNIRYVNLPAGTITNPRPAFATETITQEVGTNFSPNGTVVTYDVSGADVTINARPPHFNWQSSDMTVATIDALGVGTAVGVGTTMITGDVGGTTAAGMLTVEVIPAAFPSTPAPTPPARAAADVISLFSDAYTNITVDTFSAGFDRADVDDQMVGTDNVKRYTNHFFAGLEFFQNNNTVDATNMTTLHVDIWTPNARLFRVRLVDFTPGGNTTSDVGYDDMSTPAVVTGQWVSFDIPLAAFDMLGGRANISQMLLFTDETISETIFIDNLYFYR